MHSMGLCYRYGGGVRKDIGQAIEWYRKAAELGNSTAMVSLGECYDIKRDMDQAIHWYRKAAKLGDIEAMHHLGQCYEYGWGVEKNKSQAMEWYRKVEEEAKEQGEPDSLYFIGSDYENGTGIREIVDKSKAIYWYQKAADLGDEDAKKRLRELGEYKNSGIAQSAEEWFDMGLEAEEREEWEDAVFYYQKAAENGNEDAIEALWDF